jgi:addiction module HigA family antidote
MTARKHNPSHPGRILKQRFPGRTAVEVAAQVGVSAEYLSSVFDQRAGVSPELSSKLSQGLGTSDGFWLRMQANYDEWQASRSTL